MLTLAGKEDTIHEKGITAINGKESRSSGRKDTDNGEVKALQTLNVYSTNYGICLEQQLKETCYKKTTELEHGGLVIREYYITEDVNWYSEKEKWKKWKSFGMVQKTVRKKDGSEKKEGRHSICSIEEDVEEFARAVRGHGSVKNNLHWQFDVTFQDDKNKSMAKTGAKNLQMMKKLALALLQLVKESYKKSMKLIRYELSLDYENGIEKMLSMLDIDSIEKVLHSVEKSFQK